MNNVPHFNDVFLGLQMMFGIFQGFVRLTFKPFSFSGLAKVVLKKGKTQIFRDGSPMVYSGAVDRIIGRPPPKSGDVVLVADGTEKPIGWGLYNSVSIFCVRLMQLEEEARRLYNLRQHFTISKQNSSSSS
jgi:hypothetical protein